MHPRLPVILLSALALAAPGASFANPKDKDKGKGHSEQNADRRDDDRNDDRDHQGEGHGENDGGKMTICHVPPGNAAARHTISIGESAWQAHQAHGDYRGACRTHGGGGTGTGHGRFNDLDRNHNGVISLDEWNGDRTTFVRLDANRDGVLSPGEFGRY
jgi:EF hand domain-containing protein